LKHKVRAAREGGTLAFRVSKSEVNPNGDPLPSTFVICLSLPFLSERGWVPILMLCCLFSAGT